MAVYEEYPMIMRNQRKILVPFLVYGFSQLRALKFFVFRKMEMPETQNPPAMRVESICL